MALADAVWPDAEINRLAIDEILDEAVLFSVHARRELDMAATTNEIQLSPHMIKNFGEKEGVEKDLRKALNAIIHATDLRVWVTPAEKICFSDCGNIQMPGLFATTDKYTPRIIDTRGMAWSYLTLP